METALARAGLYRPESGIVGRAGAARPSFSVQDQIPSVPMQAPARLEPQAELDLVLGPDFYY
jgi:hypothetical protein